MKNKSEGSCSKGCLCDTCSGQSKSIKSEAFKEKAADLVRKTKEAGKKIKNAVTLGLGDTHGQEWTTTSNLSGALPGAGTTAAAALNVARRTVDAFREASDPYYNSAEHLQDLKDTEQEHLRNAEQASKNKNYEGAQRYRQMAKEVAQRITNHPLNQKAESMLKELNFKVGDTLHKVDDVTKTLPRGVEKKGPGEAYGDVEKCAPAPKDKDKTVVAGKTGEEYSKPQEEVKQMKEDKYARLAEAAFGPLNRSNPFRSASLNEEQETKKAAQQGAMEEEVEHIDEGDVVQFPRPKPTPKPSSKVITTATRRPAGPRPVKENLNQRFPDVERDIAQIMKESYKKTKLKEDATNIYIATPEQREDWLNVGRGSMDVLDYINKYKV